nr:transposase [Enterococcus cecorum]
MRDKKLERAKKLINKPSSIKKKDQRNPKYYITERNVTSDGECADNTVYRLDYDKINEEEKLDGFYVVTTDLEDKNPKVVIQANKQRWEIEESFRIMKSELNTRPMYVRTEETIYGHLLVCFLALLVYRILEKYYLSEKFTITEIITGLRNMNITYLIGGNYISSFERTDFTDKLTEIFGFENSRKVISQKYLKKFLKVVNSEKSTKLQ